MSALNAMCVRCQRSAQPRGLGYPSAAQKPVAQAAKHYASGSATMCPTAPCQLSVPVAKAIHFDDTRSAARAVPTVVTPIVLNWELHNSSNGQLYVYGHVFVCLEQEKRVLQVSKFSNSTMTAVDGSEYKLVNPDYNLETGAVESSDAAAASSATSTNGRSCDAPEAALDPYEVTANQGAHSRHKDSECNASSCPSTSHGPTSGERRFCGALTAALHEAAERSNITVSSCSAAEDVAVLQLTPPPNFRNEVVLPAALVPKRAEVSCQTTESRLLPICSGSDKCQKLASGSLPQGGGRTEQQLCCDGEVGCRVLLSHGSTFVRQFRDEDEPRGGVRSAAMQVPREGEEKAIHQLVERSSRLRQRSGSVRNQIKAPESTTAVHVTGREKCGDKIPQSPGTASDVANVVPTMWVRANGQKHATRQHGQQPFHDMTTQPLQRRPAQQQQDARVTQSREMSQDILPQPHRSVQQEKPAQRSPQQRHACKTSTSTQTGFRHQRRLAAHVDESEGCKQGIAVSAHLHDHGCNGQGAQTPRDCSPEPQPKRRTIAERRTKRRRVRECSDLDNSSDSASSSARKAHATKEKQPMLSPSSAAPGSQSDGDSTVLLPLHTLIPVISPPLPVNDLFVAGALNRFALSRVPTKAADGDLLAASFNHDDGAKMVARNGKPTCPQPCAATNHRSEPLGMSCDATGYRIPKKAGGAGTVPSSSETLNGPGGSSSLELDGMCKKTAATASASKTLRVRGCLRASAQLGPSTARAMNKDRARQNNDVPDKQQPAQRAAQLLLKTYPPDPLESSEGLYALKSSRLPAHGKSALSHQHEGSRQQKSAVPKPRAS